MPKKMMTFKSWFIKEYVILVVVLYTVAYLLTVLQNRRLEIGLVILVAAFYFGFGLRHHRKEGTLTQSIVLEYFLISLLALLLLLNLI